MAYPLLLALSIAAPPVLHLQLEPAKMELESGTLTGQRVLESVAKRVEPLHLSATLGPWEPGHYHAQVHRLETGELVVQIFDAESTLLRLLRISTARRTPDELADSLALVIAEVLSPVLPPLSEDSPPPPHDATSPTERPQKESPATGNGRSNTSPSSPSPPFPELRVGLFLGAQLHAPSGATPLGGRLMGQIFFGDWLIPVALDGWTSLQGSSGDAEVSAAPRGVGAGFGRRWRLEPVEFQIAVGPTLRWGTARGRGDRLAIDTTSFQDWGATAQGIACLDFKPVGVCAILTASRFFDYTRLLADGRVLVNLGPETYAGFLGASYTF